MTTLATILGLGGGDWPLWSPSLTVAQWATVRSPADGEIYTRRTATGSGSVDPADDLVNYFSPGYDRITAVTGPIAALAAGGTPSVSYAKNAAKASIPAIALNVRTLVYSLTGRGLVGFLGVSRGQSGTMRTEIIVDGRTVYDSTIAHGSATGCTIIGSSVADTASTLIGNAVDDPVGIPFRRTFAVYVTPTVTAITAGDGAFVAHKTRSLA